MARTVNEAFEELLKGLVPTKAQREAGSSHRATVKVALGAKLSVSNFYVGLDLALRISAPACQLPTIRRPGLGLLHG